MGTTIARSTLHAVQQFTLGTFLWWHAFAISHAAGQSLPQVKEDPQLSGRLATVRERFLAMRNQNQPEFKRLDCTLMLREPNGTWRSGNINGSSLSYPASCVKLAYLVAAMHWCRENKLPPTALDADVSPMIRVSDNVATGRVIDRITSAPNLTTVKLAQDRGFAEWLEQRQYPSRVMADFGLLYDQVLLHKSYPSNSGDAPVGAEEVATKISGGNRMRPDAGALLIAAIVDGKVEPEATWYMRELLAHARWSGDSAIGFGLPPGSIYLNKVGLAYDTLEDIAYVRLPNGKEFVLSVFSEGYCGSEKTQSYPYDSSILGVFTEMLIQELELEKGSPPVVRVDNSSPDFHSDSNWTIGSAQTEAYQRTYVYAQGVSSGTVTGAEWDLRVPEEGIYEVCAWYPQNSNRASDANFAVSHKDGQTSVAVNQQQTGGRWVRLGDFRFARDTGKVKLSNYTSELSKVIVADAIKATKWPVPPKAWRPTTGKVSATMTKEMKFY